MISTINFFEIYSTLSVLQPCILCSYLTPDEGYKVLNCPIKEQLNSDFLYDDIERLKKSNGIILITIQNGELKNLKDEYKADIDFIVCKILKSNPKLYVKEISSINKKMAAVMSGLGQYGKNQLIYTEKFGFETSIKAFYIFNPVTNLPLRNKPKYTYMDMCTNCNECIKHCPAHALHGDDYPGWLDRDLCRNFFYFGNDERFLSIKCGINEFLNNKFSEEEIKNIHTAKDFYNLFGFYCTESEIPGNDGQLYALSFDYCQECMNQLPCRKIEHKYTKAWKIRKLNEYTSLRL